MVVKSASLYQESRHAKFNDKRIDYWPIIWANERTVVSLPASLEGVENGKLDINDSSKLIKCSDALVHKFNNMQHPDARLMGHPYAIGALELMIRYAAVDGVFMKMSEGYRPYSQQELNFVKRYTTKRPSEKQWNKLCKGNYASRKNKVDAYKKTWNGKSYWLKNATEAGLAVPGTSNHGLGLAFDLGIYVPFTSVGPKRDRNPERGTLSPETAQTDWLIRNAWAFGFVWEVQRGQAGFEAWHVTWAPGLPAFAHINFDLIKEGLNFVTDKEKVVTDFKTIKKKHGKKVTSSRQLVMELPGKTELFWSEDPAKRKFVEEALLPARWWVEAPMTWFDDWTSEKGGPSAVGDESPIVFPRPPLFYRPPID